MRIQPAGPSESLGNYSARVAVRYERDWQESAAALAALGTTGTAAPTSGLHAVGEFVRNTAPAELGTAGSKYLVFGWTCVTAGTPGTWLQTRTLTGN